MTATTFVDTNVLVYAASNAPAEVLTSALDALDQRNAERRAI